jgi:hypothetical protein
LHAEAKAERRRAPVSFLILIFVESIKSPTSFVEVAFAAMLKGIGELCALELMLK